MSTVPDSRSGKPLRLALAAVFSVLFVLGALFVGARLPATQPSLWYVTDRVRLALRDAGAEYRLETSLNDPSAVFIDRDGSIFLSERRNHVIRRIDGDLVTRIAGTGRGGFTGDGGSAVNARLNYPAGIAGDDAGSLFLADSQNHRVRRISPEGIIETIAGTGQSGFAGDGGPATQALLAMPNDLALGPAGDVFVADFENNRIRRISGDGTIETAAGNGEKGFSGDGGPAELASLNGPYGIFVDDQGVLYIADSGNHRIRRVGKNGTIDTIAGTGEPGFAGDGGLASAAMFDSPEAVLVTPSGEIIIDDEHNHRIRKILRSGIVVTIAGTGEAAFCGDGGPSSDACLNDPEDFVLGRDGSLYIADGDNHLLRRVRPDGTITTIAGSAPE